jgi:hypothetical protein
VRNSLFLILLSSFTLSSFAKSCPNIRLDKNFPNNNPKNEAKYKTMQHAPVLNQSLGICYAYTATQMADAVRRKRQLERGKSTNIHISSPLFAAVNDWENWDENGVTLDNNGDLDFPVEGGFPCQTFNKLKEDKTCPRDKLEKFYTSKGYNEKQFFKKIYEVEEKFNKKRMELAIKYMKERELESIHEKYETKVDNTFVSQVSLGLPYESNSANNEYLEVQSCRAGYKNELYNDLQLIFNNLLPAKELFLSYFSLEMFDSPYNMNILFRFICPSKERIAINTKSECTDYKVSESHIPFFDSLTDEIIDQLEEDSLPVGISYCANVLKRGKNFKGIASSDITGHKYKQKDGKDDCGRHASIVIGSREKNGSCELLIRNSWGTSCSTYSNDFDCEQGNIWIPQDVLQNNLYRIHYL